MTPHLQTISVEAGSATVAADRKRRFEAIFSRRIIFGFDRIDTAVLALYSALLAWTIAHHEPWADEAQAWLIARDCSLRDLLFHRMHYEGTPALWHVILWVLIRLHLSWSCFNWIGGAFAVAGIAVLLRYAPFPRIFRIALPFTFFLLYQYAAIARSYTLFPLLLFTLCALYRSTPARPVWFCLTAAVLANLSVHALIVSLGFALLYAADLRKQRRARGERLLPPADLAAIALLTLAAAFSAAIVLPAPDVGFAVRDKVKDHSGLQRILAKLQRPETLPAGAPPLDPLLLPAAPAQPRLNHFETLVWNEWYHQPGPRLPRLLYEKLVIVLSTMTFPIAGSNLLACLFLILTGCWLWSRRSLPLLLPYAALICFFTYIWVWVHHTGLSLLVLLAAVWIAFGRPQRRGPPWLSQAFALVSLAVVILQIAWAAYAITSDTTRLYSSGRVVSQLLAARFPGKRIASFFYETGDVQPWSPSSVFLNQAHAYWDWSDAVDPDRRRTETLAQHPDAVLVGDLGFGDQVLMNQWMPLIPKGNDLGQPYIAWWESHGYHETHRFCGYRPFRLGIANVACEVLLEPNLPENHHRNDPAR